MITKLKLSFIMLRWNVAEWIDESSPSWFRITYWSIYHMTHSDPMELKN